MYCVTSAGRGVLEKEMPGWGVCSTAVGWLSVMGWKSIGYKTVYSKMDTVLQVVDFKCVIRPHPDNSMFFEPVLSFFDKNIIFVWFLLLIIDS